MEETETAAAPPAPTTPDASTHQQQFVSTATTASASTAPPARRRYHGLIKREPRDFEVREIDQDGRVADITRPATLPPEQLQQLLERARCEAAHVVEAAQASAPVTTTPAAALETLLAPEHVEALAALQARAEAALDAGTEDEDKELLAASVVAPLPSDKPGRTRLHQAVRARCPCLRTAQVPVVEGRPELQMVVRVDDRDLSALRTMRPLLPDPTQSLALYAYVARGRDDPGALDAAVLGPVACKEARRTLHNLLHANFQMLQVSTAMAEQGDAGPVLRAQWKPLNQQRQVKKRKREDGDGKGDGREATRGGTSQVGVLRFVLRKEDVEHLDSLNRLSHAVRIPQSSLCHAGVKDRRAITYQFITAHRIAPDRVAGLGQVRLPGVELGDLEAGWPQPLQPGHSQGNAFRLRVRDIRPAAATEGDDEAAWRAEMETRLTEVQAHGLINFFGPQRLSSPRGLEADGPAAWEVGRALLRKDWDGLLRLLLGPREGDYEKLRYAKAKFWSGEMGARHLLNFWPRSLPRERSLIKGLCIRGEKEVAKALKLVPHHALTQWANAYQSWLFNRAASERVRLYGLRAVEGDLAKLSGPSPDQQAHVRPATAAEAEALSIHDVLLPLPGPGATLPGHAVGQVYREMLEADGLWELLQPGAPKDPDAAVRINGSYRPLLARPRDLEWTFKPGQQPHGLTLDISFKLGAGEYATTLLREVLGGEPETYRPDGDEQDEASGGDAGISDDDNPEGNV